MTLKVRIFIVTIGAMLFGGALGTCAVARFSRVDLTDIQTAITYWPLWLIGLSGLALMIIAMPDI